VIATARHRQFRHPAAAEEDVRKPDGAASNTGVHADLHNLWTSRWMEACRHVETAGDTRWTSGVPPLATCTYGAHRLWTAEKSEEFSRAAPGVTERRDRPPAFYTITVGYRSDTICSAFPRQIHSCPQAPGTGGKGSPDRWRRPSANYRTHYVPLVRTSRLTTTAGILALTAALAGCTSGVGGAAGPAKTGAAAGSGTSSNTAAPSSSPSPDSTRLQAALLELGDLPKEWSAGGSPERDSGTIEAFHACLGAPMDQADRLMEAFSPVFTDGATRYLYSWVGSFRSQQRVDADTALFGDARAADCFAEALTDGLRETTRTAGTSFGRPQVEVIVGSGGGPSNVVATASATVPATSTSGRDMTLYWQYVFLAGRSTEAVVGTGTVDAPLTTDVRNRAIEAVAQRVAAF
jgi:hypothetical protein